MELNIHEMCQMETPELMSYFMNISQSEGVNGSFADFAELNSKACDQLHFHRIVSRLVPVIFAVIVVVGVIGNSLVLVVVLFGNQMRNTTNVLILNLAVSDLFFVAICIPPTAVDYAIGWPFGELCCKVIQYLIHVSLFGSVYTLVLLSLDRYLAVVYPVRSISLRTVCNTTIAIACIWMVTATTCIPVLFVFISKDIYTPGEIRTICTFDRMSYNEAIYQSMFFVASLAMPLVTILWLYMTMLVRLWRGSAATHGPGPLRDTRNVCKGQENKRRVTRMIVAVIIVFAICWTPLQVVLLLRNVNLYDISDSGALVVIQIITHCLAYCNSCLNPILYAFFSPNFRAAFLNTCRNHSHKYFGHSLISKQEPPPDADCFSLKRYEDGAHQPKATSDLEGARAMMANGDIPATARKRAAFTQGQCGSTQEADCAGSFSASDLSSIKAMDPQTGSLASNESLEEHTSLNWKQDRVTHRLKREECLDADDSNHILRGANSQSSVNQVDPLTTGESPALVRPHPGTEAGHEYPQPRHTARSKNTFATLKKIQVTIENVETNLAPV